MCDPEKVFYNAPISGGEPFAKASFDNVVLKAIISDSADFLKFLLENFQFEKDYPVNSLPCVAVNNNSLKCLQVLHKKCFDLNHDGQSAFLLACTEANFETFKYFIDNGVNNINMKFHDSNALCLAVERRLLKGYLNFEDKMIISYLIENGIDIHFGNDKLRKYLEERGKMEIWNFVRCCQQVSEYNEKSYKIKQITWVEDNPNYWYSDNTCGMNYFVSRGENVFVASNHFDFSKGCSSLEEAKEFCQIVFENEIKKYLEEV